MSELDGSAPVVEAVDLEVRYGGLVAVGGVSLAVHRGETVGLVGPNGAGKSSLLAAIAGQISVDRGKIRIGGADVTRRAPHFRSRLGLGRTFQVASVFQGLTVFENLLVAEGGKEGGSLVRALVGAGADRSSRFESGERVWEMLDRFEMAEHANLYGRELSGGQLRLVEVMRCLIRQPSAILLDEPMVGVAPFLVDRLLEHLTSIAKDGIALLIVEHALEVVRDLCSRTVVMAEGRIVAEGAYDQVMNDAAVQEAYLS